MRILEIHDEKLTNDSWKKFECDENEEEILQTEIIETENNEDLCRQAKEKELKTLMIMVSMKK